MVIYRPGAVTVEEIRRVAGPAELFIEDTKLGAAPREALPSPGVGLRHYAPVARLILVALDAQGGETDLASKLFLEAKVHSSERVGVMWVHDMPGEHGFAAAVDPLASFAEVFAWGSWSQPEQLAQRLFAGLRALDAAGCTVILCPVPPERGIGEAIRDRLRKAAWRDEV
jgi:L-threonylcarbamoyladenylate synthase